MTVTPSQPCLECENRKRHERRGLMNFLNSIASAFDSQITAAENEAQTVAQAVAGWGVIVVLELGIVIYLLARRRG
jgi:hypothetical protein